MLVVRPIQDCDYPALFRCAEESGVGFTSLPVDESMLRQRIAHSIASFAKAVDSPHSESYLMVAEESETGEIVGTTGIEAAIGFDLPFYSYHISTVVHSSRKLGVHNVVKVLTLGNNYTGHSEICTLFLRPQWRRGLNGRLLSKARFLLMAEHPQRFSSVVFAEMRGVSDENGNSPFWAWLKKHFFSIDFTLADYLTGIGKKGFIADLMPKLPIYVNLLSPEAQAVIGQVHQQTRPALKLLEEEGFCCRGHIDIFDAGPTVECDRSNIESIRHSNRAQIKIGEPKLRHQYLICNTLCNGFRAVVAPLTVDDDQPIVTMSQEVADALQITTGHRVRYIALT